MDCDTVITLFIFPFQSLKGRAVHCHYDEVMQIMNGLPAKVFGNDNEDLGVLNGGSLDYLHFKEVLRDHRVFVYGGTWPAPYTLGFMEALMTGIPVVALGQHLAQNPNGIAQLDRFEFYEVHEFIKNGENGLLVTIGDTQELSQAIISCIRTDTGKQLGKKARKVVEEKFSLQSVVERYKNLYMELTLSNHNIKL